MFFKKPAAFLPGIEACRTAHYWGREHGQSERMQKTKAMSRGDLGSISQAENVWLGVDHVLMPNSEITGSYSHFFG